MTTTVASLSVTLEPDDNWTVITVRRQDDLPAHIKSSSLGRGAVWSTEPQNKPPSYKCNVSGTLRAVEFINNAWYLLAYSALYGAYRTRARDHAPRENKYRLGWWTDEELIQQSLPPPTAPEPPRLVSRNPSGTYRVPQESSSEEEPRQESEEDSESDADSHHTAHSSHSNHSVPQNTVPPPQPINLLFAPQNTPDPPQITQPPPLKPSPPPPPMSAINATTGGASGAGGTPQNGGGLKGISPTPFTGDRSQSAQFKREMLRFIKLNSEHELIKEYYSRILYCLTLFRG